MGDRARARQAEAGAAGHALQLCGGEGQVRSENDDATSGRRGRLVLLGEEAADRYPGDAELARGAEVREEEHAEVPPGTTRLRVPMPPFQPRQRMRVPAPTAPSEIGQPEAASTARPASAAST